MADNDQSPPPESASGPVQDNAYRLLVAIFHDQPDLLKAMTLGDLESGEVLNVVQSRDKLFGSPVFQFTVGRTHAGKTTLGNLLFGEAAMRSTGYQDCTDYVGRVRLKSDLCYFDTPGAGGEETYENFARMALGLPQPNSPQVDYFRMLDFTDAVVLPSDVVDNVTEVRITAQTWKREFASKFPPDVIVYVVAPHMLFLRDDRAYLHDMLKQYGDKVVIALNRWDGVTKDTDIDNVRNQIESVYRRAYPDGSMTPRFAIINAKTGSGIHELTALICGAISPEKLGGMQAVLSGDLKRHAQEERSRRYRKTVNRIAARLALNKVDQQAGGMDLISLAAHGIARFGVLTFEGDDDIRAFRDGLNEHVRQEAERVRRERTEDIVSRDVQTGTKDIVTREPVFDTVEIIENQQHKISEEITESRGVGFWKSAGIATKSLWNRFDNLLEGGTQAERDAIREGAKKDMVETTTRVNERYVDIPVTRYEQKIVDYQDKVVATVTEVLGVTENVVGTRALQGAIPVIELLVSIGLGVEEYCTGQDRDGGIEKAIEQSRQIVRLELDRVAGKLKRLVDEGVTAESRIAELLDGLNVR
jgi:hypothetical protein